MPELPEVETARRYVENFCKGSRIIRVDTRLEKKVIDDIIFENGTERELDYVKNLMDKTLKSVNRKGKQLWFEFNDSKVCLLLHFGMTGSFSIRGKDVAKYKSFKTDETDNWPPRFAKLEIEFSNGEVLAFCDPRRLGRIKLREDPLNSPPISNLGMDPFNEDLTDIAGIYSRFQQYSAPIKSILLDQEKVFCGIGNYLADEILYHSMIHPGTPSNKLSQKGIEVLIDNMKSILSIAIECGANYAEFPTHWIFHVRWNKAKSKNQAIKMPNGEKITFESHGGRTTAFVASRQKINGIYVERLKSNAKISQIKPDPVLDKPKNRPGSRNSKREEKKCSIESTNGINTRNNKRIKKQ